MSTPPRATLCWDCAKATGFCNWSSSAVPIKGWVANKVEREDYYDDLKRSYIVIECPEFVRDSYSFGLNRTENETIYDIAQGD